MRSVMNHQFGKAPNVKIPRSTFDRSHGYKTTFDAGKLIPIYVDEVLPGDTFNVNLHGFARLATPIYPIMDNMFMETFFFAVPMRLLWDNWQRFCGERSPNPSSSIDYTIPTVPVVLAANDSLAGYFGLPTIVAGSFNVSALPFRAYNLIWNEWFRDQNLQNSVDVNNDSDGPDAMGDYLIKSRCKRHDYFTSCLPWLQKGDSVMLSLGSDCPVTGFGSASFMTDRVNSAVYETDATATRNYAAAWDDTSKLRLEEDPNNSGYPNIRADLSSATAGTVNELREAIQVQRLLEKDARSGTRYTEILQSHFGVYSDDARLQRPEYLGGGSTPVNISAVPRTDTNPGELGAMGIASFSGHGFNKSFNEHCIVIGLVNVRADLTYQEGIDKMWLRESRFDFYWPTLAHLGEQAVLNKEIFIDGGTISGGTTDDVFGYQERFAEYRYKPSKITGQFRSNDAATLDAWHLGIEFGSTPTLDSTFITDDPPVDRVIATPTEPHFLFDSYIQCRCTRPMPVYSIPGYIDHF